MPKHEIAPPWTAAEAAQVARMWMDGAELDEIAKHLGRPRSGVYRITQRLVRAGIINRRPRANAAPAWSEDEVRELLAQE